MLFMVSLEMAPPRRSPFSYHSHNGYYTFLPLSLSSFFMACRLQSGIDVFQVLATRRPGRGVEPFPKTAKSTILYSFLLNLVLLYCFKFVFITQRRIASFPCLINIRNIEQCQKVAPNGLPMFFMMSSILSV